MADTLAHLKRDRSFRKRLLRFAGYYHGKIDWLNTKEFRFSQAKWKNETEGLRRILASFVAFVFFFGGFYDFARDFSCNPGKKM